MQNVENDMNIPNNTDNISNTIDVPNNTLRSKKAKTGGQYYNIFQIYTCAKE